MYRWCQKWNAFQTIFGSYLHLEKIRIFDDLCDLSKTCHPINDPSSCHPMWPDHMMIYGMATFGISFEDSKISKNMKFFFMKFHDSWRLQFDLKISSSSKSVPSDSCPSSLFFFVLLFETILYYLFFMSWTISFFLF